MWVECARATGCCAEVDWKSTSVVREGGLIPIVTAKRYPGGAVASFKLLKCNYLDAITVLYMQYSKDFRNQVEWWISILPSN
jgi:hypothetical protein